MDKPKSYGKANEYKNYLVFINETVYGITSAVSKQKAINNVRYQLYGKYGKCQPDV